MRLTTRWKAAMLVGLMGLPGQGRQAVAQALPPGNAAAARLTAKGAEAIPILCAQLACACANSAATRRTLLASAAALTGEENIPALVGLFTDPVVRESARVALEQTTCGAREKAFVAKLLPMTPAESISFLLANMNAPEPDVRHWAAQFLAESGAPGVTTTLMQAVEKAAPESRLVLIGVLGKRKGKGALMVLVEQAQVPEEPVRIAAYRALDARRDIVPEACADLYNRRLPLATSDGERRILLAGIARLADPDSLPVLCAELAKGRLPQEILTALLPVAERAEQAGKKEEAIAAYRQIAAQSRVAVPAQEAANRLRALGITPPVPSR
jgi:hypothetical protein